MQQKITWMRFLLTGISALLLFLTLSCCDDEYAIQVDYVYINETDVVLSYSQIALDNSDTTELFKIEPKSQVVRTVRGESERNPTLTGCCADFLGDLQGIGFPILIQFSDIACITYVEGSGPTTSNIAAYEARSLSASHFEFVYRFTEEVLTEAGVCN
jgi:hypothetical protein